MNPLPSSLVHRVLMPRRPSGSTHPALLMLHGRGADEEDLIGLTDFLDDRLLVISARAPFSFPYGGHTWYEADEVGVPEPAMFKTSYEKLSTFVDDALGQYPIDARRLFLFGFSMGTVMSYALALTRPELVRGVVANSGYVPEGTFLTLRWSDIGNVEFFIAHGTDDPVIPVAFARHAKELFEKSQAAMTYREYPMSHEISEESIGDIAAWLQPLIDS